MITTIDSIKQSISAGETLRQMSEAYSELYVAKLDRVRVMIERNRVFAMSLAAAFHEVKAAAVAAGVQYRINKKPRLRVAIFSNYGFFIGMETQMAQSFITTQEDDTSDLLIIGRSGGEVLRDLEYKKPFDILIFTHDLPRPEELAKAQAKMSEYDSVSVIYPQFQTVGRQTPTMVDISGGQLASVGAQQKLITSILEPEAPIMLQFFESQIMGLLLEQAFLETELAHAAARLLMMDAAQGRAKEYVTAQSKLLRLFLKQRRDSRIFELSLQFPARKEEVQ